MFAKDSDKKSIHYLMVLVIREKKKLFAYVLPLVFLIGISHSFYIFSLGPLLKSFFTQTKSHELVSLLSLFPVSSDSIFYSFFSSVRLSGEHVLFLLPTFLFISSVVKNISTYFYQVIINKICFFFSRIYRECLFAGVVLKDYQSLLQKTPAQWMSIVMNDVFLLQDRLIVILNHSVKDMIVLLSSAFLLIFVYGSFAFILLFAFFIAYFFLSFFSKRIFLLTSKFQENLSFMTNSLLELRRRYYMIKTVSSEKIEINNFRFLSEEYRKTVLKSSFLRVILPPILEGAGFCLLALMLSRYAGNLTGNEDDSLSVLLGFAIFATAIRPLKNIGEQIGLVGEIKGALKESKKHIKSFSLDFLSHQNSDSKPLYIEKELIFKKLSCGIEEKTFFSVENLSLTLGQSYFIGGPSGSGKSTFLKTLVGLVPAKKWESSFSKKDFSRECYYIAQRAYTFDESIKDIVLYGHPDRASVTKEDIWASLKSAELSKFVKKLPHKLNTRVSSLKESLSGGQMQRLLLSRVFLAKERILLLDEASSQLDGRKSHILILNLLEDIKKKNKILIVVHHDVNLAKLFDHVFSVQEEMLTRRKARKVCHHEGPALLGEFGISS